MHGLMFDTRNWGLFYLIRSRRRTSADGSLKLMTLRKGSGCSEEPSAAEAFETMDCNSTWKSGVPV